MANKPYGLILSNKKGPSGAGAITRPSIFDEDSDSDTPTVSKPTGFNKTKKQDLINHQKALEEDPTVFQYDELYDDMEQKKRESKLARKDIDRKPKYISKLLEAAERRKKENERRIERQVQKEREAEGEEFKDKESFVTSAYKQKLEEMRVLEEQEKREEYLEAIGDVTKQGNLDGFYRHLYDQKVNFEDRLKKDDIEVKEEVLSDNDQGVKRSADEVSDEEKPTVAKKSGAKRRKYRSRQDSQSGDNSEKEEEVVEVKKEHLPSNLDADSDFSVDSSDSESDTEKKDKKSSEKDESIEHEGEKLQLPAKGNVLSDNAALLKKQEEDGTPVQIAGEQKDKGKENEEVNGEEKQKKPKIDIWKKRTVDTVFDEAVVRYFERKAARGW